MDLFPALRRPRAAGAGLHTKAIVVIAATVALSVAFLLPATVGASPPDWASANGPATAAERASAPDRILVKRKPGVSEQRLQGIIQAQGGRTVGYIPRIDVHEINVPEVARDRVIQALSRNPAIKFAEPDYLVELSAVLPNDPRYGNAWHLPKIDAPTAWTASKADNIIVAVLDTGVDASHPDLAGKLVTGWNSVDQSSNNSDIHGHGTMVSGTVGAATNNATGVASVGWNAMIMPIRVSNRSDGAAYDSDMARGLTWAADNGAHVANMSYMSWQSSTVQNAAQYMRNKGGIVFGAAGNGGQDAGVSPTPYVVVVSATTSSDVRTSWSNFGSYVDLAAPGASIQTTSRGGGYSSVNGTSFSSPISAAVGALVMAANPQLSPAQIEQILFDSADDLGAAGWDPYYGWGRVNAGNAVMMAWSEDIDRTSPEVLIASPTADATVGGEVLVRIEATDDVGVVQVTLLADGQEVGTETVAPFEFVWDTTLIAEGTVNLYAEALDAAGNTGTHSVKVNVQQEVVEPEPAPEPEPEPAPEPAPAPEPEPAPALTLTSTSINDGRVWTAIVTLNGPEGAATAGSWDFGKNNVGGCTISSGTSCSFSLSGIRKNIGAVTYTDQVNNLSVTVGKP